MHRETARAGYLQTNLIFLRSYSCSLLLLLIPIGELEHEHEDEDEHDDEHEKKAPAFPACTND